MGCEAPIPRPPIPRDPGRWLLYVVLAAFTLFSVFPFVFSVLTSLKGQAFAPGLLPHPATLEHYRELMTASPLFLRWVLNSLVVATVSVIVLAVLSLLGGYALARIPFLGRQAVFILMLASLMIPGQVLWIPNYATLSELGWINTWWALIPGLVGSLTSGTFLVSQFLKGLPEELEEAAKLDGLSRFGTFWRIVLPLAGPAIASVSITGFMASWNMFAWPVIVLDSLSLFTLPVGLNFFKGLHVTRWTLIMAGSMFNTIPVLLVFIFFQRYFIKGIAMAGMKE